MVIGWKMDVHFILVMENKENNHFASVSDGAMDISHHYLSCQLCPPNDLLVKC